MSKSREEMLNDLIRGRAAKTDRPATPSGSTPSGASGGAVGAAGGTARPAPTAPDDRQPGQLGRPTAVLGGKEYRIAQMGRYNAAPEPHPPHELRVAVMPSAEAGQWAAALSWPEPPDGSQISVFRVIAVDGEAPNSDCDSVEATLGVVQTQLVVDDTTVNPPHSASRFYEVWRYLGKSVADAVATPPYLYARGQLVWPPLGIHPSVDNGQVVVTWRAFPDRAERYRWLRQVPKGRRRTVDEAISIGGAGFVDREVSPGQEYEYEVYTEVALGDHEQVSDLPVRFRLRVPEVLHPVADLRVEPRPGQPGLVDLSWSTVPSGVVRIYRADSAPAAGIHDLGQVEESAVHSDVLGLRPQDMLDNHVEVDGSRTVMRDVIVPPEQAEVYFTPVTLAGGSALPGQTVPLLRPHPPRDPFLEDRVDWVLLVFTWPEGASQVNLFITAPGDRVNPATAAPILTLSREEHSIFGGFRIPRQRLAPGPCTLHLSGYRLYSGMAAHSAPVSLDYDFSVVAWYQLERTRGSRLRGGPKLMLTVWAQAVVAGVDMILAYRPDGLPLSTADPADVLARLPGVTIQDQRARATPIDLTQLLKRPLPKSGYMRLLVRPGVNVALVDPPADQLRLDGR